MVTFYKINDDGTPGIPVLFLDTLKVSTIEQTASQVDARGGKGNPKLVTWDYGKEITVNITDALFSPKSMAILFGNGSPSAKTTDTITRTAMARVNSVGDIDFITVDIFDANDGAVRKKVDMLNNPTTRNGYISFADAGIAITDVISESGTSLASGSSLAITAINSAITSSYAGQRVFLKYTQPVKKSTIEISGDTFPGTYYVTGDTYARSDVSGKDEFFQFVIPKAKMSSQNTITLEAEGDPSTFNMNLTVLRPDDGVMMKLIQYELTANG